MADIKLKCVQSLTINIRIHVVSRGSENDDLDVSIRTQLLSGRRA